MMNGREKSHPAIVAAKPTNKADRDAGEPAEPRAGTEGNAEQGGTLRTPGRAGGSHGLDRVRQAAKERKKERFTAPAPHHRRFARRGVLRFEEEGFSRRGRTDVGGLRSGPRAQARRPAFAGSSGSVSDVAEPAGLYPPTARTAAPPCRRPARGENRA